MAWSDPVGSLANASKSGTGEVTGDTVDFHRVGNSHAAHVSFSRTAGAVLTVELQGATSAIGDFVTLAILESGVTDPNQVTAILTALNTPASLLRVIFTVTTSGSGPVTGFSGAVLKESE